MLVGLARSGAEGCGEVHSASGPPPSASADGLHLGLRVRLLRGFGLTRDGVPLDVPLSGQRLIAFLALRGCSLLRTYVASSLWLDCDEARSGANLRSAIWRVRVVDPRLLEAGADRIALGRAVWVDLRESDNLAHRVLNDIGAACEAPVGEHDLAGDVLPDWYEEWVVFERERFRQLRLHALEALCRHLTAMRLYARAIAAGVAAVQGEPYRESAHRVLIEAHLAEGNRGEAVRQFTRYCRVLSEELQLEPAPHMVALVAECRPGATVP